MYRCEFAGRLTAFCLIGAVWCYVSEVVKFNSTVSARLEHSCHALQRRLPCVSSWSIALSVRHSSKKHFSYLVWQMVTRCVLSYNDTVQHTHLEP